MRSSKNELKSDTPTVRIPEKNNPVRLLHKAEYGCARLVMLIWPEIDQYEIGGIGKDQTVYLPASDHPCQHS